MINVQFNNISCVLSPLLFSLSLFSISYRIYLIAILSWVSTIQQESHHFPRFTHIPFINRSKPKAFFNDYENYVNDYNKPEPHAQEHLALTRLKLSPMPCNLTSVPLWPITVPTVSKVTSNSLSLSSLLMAPYQLQEAASLWPSTRHLA